MMKNPFDSSQRGIHLSPCLKSRRGFRIISPTNQLAVKRTRKCQRSNRGLTLLTLSLATSLDALAVGLSMAFLGVSVWFPGGDHRVGDGDAHHSRHRPGQPHRLSLGTLGGGRRGDRLDPDGAEGANWYLSRYGELLLRAANKIRRPAARGPAGHTVTASAATKPSPTQRLASGSAWY